MALPSTGPLHAWQINRELGRPDTQAINLNDSQVRSLAGRASGAISYSHLRGKSWIIDSLTIVAGYLPLYEADKSWALGIRGASENIGMRMSGTGSYQPLGSFSKNTIAGRRIQAIYTTEPSALIGEMGYNTTSLVLIMHGHVTRGFFDTIEVNTVGIGLRGSWANSAATFEHSTLVINANQDTIPVTRFIWDIPTWEIIPANSTNEIILR